MASKSLSFLLFGEDISASRAFEKVAASAEKADATVKGAFSRGSVLGVGTLVAGLGFAAKGAADFQTQMTRLVTAAGESQANLNMVSKGVMAVSTATGTSLKATGDAMYYIESAGFHGSKGLQVLKAAAEGAKVEGADTKVVADALTTALTDLGKKAGPPAQVMSQLVATVAHGKMTMDDLAGSLHSVLPNAAKLGITFPQVAGAIATMTAQGISADQATQNLNHAILSLSNPTAVMTKAMAALGLNSSTVAKNIGKDGLTGTLEELSNAILQHMGPAGLTLSKALNTSQIAAGKVTEGYKALTPVAKAYFDSLVNGTKQTQLQAAGTAGLTLAQDTQVKQLVVLYKRANGFNDLLKSGAPDALTYAAAMAKITGGQTGLQVALHLTGDNMTTFKSNVNDISKATSDAGGHVQDFALKQQTLNQKLDTLKTTASNLGVELGNTLVPALSSAASWVLKHQGATELLIGTLVGAKAATMGFRLAVETLNAVKIAGGGLASGIGVLKSGFLSLAGVIGTGGAVGVAVVGLGVIIGGAIALWQHFGGAAHAQVKPVAELTQAIKDDSDAVGEHTKAYLNDKLAMDGSYQAGLKLGVSQATVLAATMGNTDAQNTLNTAINKARDAYAAATTHVATYGSSTRAGSFATRQASSAQIDAKRAADQLAGSTGLLGAQVRASAQAARDQAAALSGVVPSARNAKMSLDSVNAAIRNIPPSKNVQIYVDTSAAIASVESLVRAINGQVAYVHVAQIGGAGPSGGRASVNAAGGYLSDGWNVVGDQGPELVYSSGRGGRVMTASETKPLRQGGGNIYINVNAGMGTDGNAVGRQIVSALERVANSGTKIHIGRAVV